MDFRDVDCVPGDWMALAEVGDQWPACAKAVMNLRVSQKPITYITYNIYLQDISKAHLQRLTIIEEVNRYIS